MVDGPLGRALRARDATRDARISPDAGRWLHTLATRFLLGVTDPEATLSRHVAEYLVQKRAVGEDVTVDARFVSRVLAIHTGLARPLVDPGQDPDPGPVAEALRDHGAPAACARALAEALLSLRHRGPEPGPRLAIDVYGEDIAGRRAVVRAIASWALGSPLRVIRASTADTPPLAPSAARTLVARPLQVVRLDNPIPSDRARIALLRGTLDEVDLRGTILVRVGDEPLDGIPGVPSLHLPVPAHGLRLVRGGTAPAPAPQATPVPPETPDESVLLSLEPVDGPCTARDHLAGLYRAWAQAHGHLVEVLHEPMTPQEPALMQLIGPDVRHLLNGERGLHRVRRGDRLSIVRVRVGPGQGRIRPVVVTDVAALKVQGAWGGRVRSRVACDNGLVLQNERSIAENRHRAIELADAWAAMPPAADGTVRRIDLDAPHVHDDATGFSSSSADALAPDALESLLRQRATPGSDDGDIA